jgi:hypothetical protein
MQAENRRKFMRKSVQDKTLANLKRYDGVATDLARTFGKRAEESLNMGATAKSAVDQVFSNIAWVVSAVLREAIKDQESDDL